MLGRLSKDNVFKLYALPFTGQQYLVTTLAEGPDGKLWYLRGDHIGEIVSGI